MAGSTRIRFGAPMLILLPPSEGKSREATGSPVDLATLSFAEQLTDRRERLLDVLEKQSGISRKRALAALGIPASQAEDVDLNGVLRQAYSAPAAEVYSGVLFERLGLDSLSPTARRRASERVLISSALWGFLRPDDAIPYYRLSAGAKLPRIGGLAAFWRPALAEAMQAAGLDRPDIPILDMRSGGYAAAWKPREAKLYAVRPFTEYPDGSRKPVSHWAKATRGDVTRHLLRARSMPKTIEAAADLLEQIGYRIELGAKTLDVIEPAPS